MKITLPSGKTAWLIGDPHLGRKFETGVPLHRRGEREKKQMERFVTELNTQGVDYNIMVGDLFDHPHVGYGVTVAAAEAYRAAAKANWDIEYIAMAGNHDLPRNLGVVGAWDAFAKMLQGSSVNVATTPRIKDEMAIFPWDWSCSALDQLELLQHEPASVAIGHWDLRSYGGDDSHIAPVDQLYDMGILQVFSGHYHTAGDYPVGNGVVHCTGSMEPYSHAEDPDGEIYVTLTLTEANDGRDLTDKCVRLLLADDEEVPYDLDCMALTYKRQTEHSEQLQTLGTHDFDWRGIMEEALAPLVPEVRSFIQDRIGS
jgi:Calcineurin-like phosphoesterase